MAGDPTATGLLMLAYWYPPENESGALRPARFCKYLGRVGYRPVVVAAPFGNGSTPGVHRTETPTTPGLFKSLFWRLARRVLPFNDRLEWCSAALREASRLITSEKLSVVFSTSPPLATHVVAWVLKKKFRVRWIADFRDPLVGNPFRSGFRGRILDGIVERLIVTNASAVIVNTEPVLRSFQARYPQLADKFHVIWNGYDPEEELAAEALPARSFRLISHVGTLYGGRHPGMLVESLARLVKSSQIQASAVRLKLIGEIAHDAPWCHTPALELLKKEGCLQYSDGIVPRDEAKREMAQADYLLLLDLNERAAGLQVPAKIFEYVRIGRPVLAFTSSGSPVERILGASGIRHVCIHPGESDDAVDSKVRELLAMPADPVAPSAWFRDQFDAVLQTQTLSAIIEASRPHADRSGESAGTSREMA